MFRRSKPHDSCKITALHLANITGVLTLLAINCMLCYSTHLIYSLLTLFLFLQLSALIVFSLPMLHTDHHPKLTLIIIPISHSSIIETPKTLLLANDPRSVSSEQLSWIKKSINKQKEKSRQSFSRLRWQNWFVIWKDVCEMTSFEWELEKLKPFFSSSSMLAP